LRRSQIRPGNQRKIDRLQIENLLAEEGKRAELDVLIFKLPVAQELQRRPVVLNLPHEIRESDEDEQRDTDGGPAVEEQASLGGE